MRLSMTAFLGVTILTGVLYAAEPQKSAVEQCKAAAKVEADRAGKKDLQEAAKIHHALVKQCEDPKGTAAKPPPERKSK
jgi:hypothetical protein